MGKKIRYQYLTGALLEPYLQYTKKLQFCINPVSDPRGARIAEQMYKQALNTRPRMKAQKFQTTIDYDLTSNSSYVIFNYLNGYRFGYALKNIEMIEMQEMHLFVNKMVEFQRELAGFEDEYQDEEKKWYGYHHADCPQQLSFVRLF